MNLAKRIDQPERRWSSSTNAGSPGGGARRRWWPRASAAGAVTSLVLVVAALPVSSAYAAEAPVGLGTASGYSVLGGQTVTNTGSTTLSGDLGVSPGTAITGFPPGTVGGATHAADAQAGKAQADLKLAYNDAAGRAPTASIGAELAGRTLTAGVYKSTGPTGIGVAGGTLTLNGQGNPNAVFIFQVAKTLITSSAAKIKLTNGAQACHVYWQVASSATLGTRSSFVGTIMALTSVSVTTRATVEGRALARTGSVTLDANTFTDARCGTSPTPSSSASSTPATSTPSSTASAAPVLSATGTFDGALLTLAAVLIAAGLAIVFLARRQVAARHRR